MVCPCESEGEGSLMERLAALASPKDTPWSLEREQLEARASRMRQQDGYPRAVLSLVEEILAGGQPKE